LCRGFFFDSYLIVSGGVKLFCNLDVFCFVEFKWFWELTLVFAGEFEDCVGKLSICIGLWWERLAPGYISTHRDEIAMDGHPAR
jgi:hypothetical protein